MCLIGFGLNFVFGGFVDGAITYSFVTDQTSYTVAAGGSVGVTVYLQETVSDGDTSLLVDEDGLFQAQVTVDRNAVVPTDPATIASYSLNGAFDDVPSINVDTNSTLNVTQFVGIGASSGPDGVEDPGNSSIRQVMLLSMTIQAGAVPGETTTFDVLDDPNFLETQTFSSLIDLDDAPYGIAPFQFFVTTEAVAVPEPSTVMLMLSLGGVCGGIFVLRRRRRSAEKDGSLQSSADIGRHQLR
jgi:hypothetical protein